MENKKIDPTLWTKLLVWLKTRLSESSSLTWIIALVGYFGIQLQPEMTEYIAGIAISIIALIQFIRKDPVTVVKEQEAKLETSKPIVVASRKKK